MSSSLIYEIAYAIDNVSDNYNPNINLLSYGIGRSFNYDYLIDLYDIAYNIINDYNDEISVHYIRKSHIIFSHINNYYIIVFIKKHFKNNEIDVYVRANKFIKHLHNDIKLLSI
jgi:hypothetical protein